MNKPRILPAIGVMIVFVLAVVYGVISLSTDDPLWAVPYFDGHPGRIVIYCEGASATLNPNATDYDDLNEAINRALTRIQGHHESLGVSDQTVEDYRAQYVAIEVFYPEPVVIHSRFSTGQPNSLLIPLTGRHSQYQVVFSGRNGIYWPGPLTLKDLQPLRELLTTRGYCAAAR